MHNNDASTCNAHPAHISVPSNIKSKPVPRPPTRQRHAPIAPAAQAAPSHTHSLQPQRPAFAAAVLKAPPAAPQQPQPRPMPPRPRSAAARAHTAHARRRARPPTRQRHAPIAPRRASRALAHALVAAATPCVCVRVRSCACLNLRTCVPCSLQVPNGT